MQRDDNAMVSFVEFARRLATGKKQGPEVEALAKKYAEQLTPDTVIGKRTPG
jgi:hypothetical protein